MDLALNNLQRLICQKKKNNNQPTIENWYSVKGSTGNEMEKTEKTFRIKKCLLWAETETSCI